jgi:hypothetical protein
LLISKFTPLFFWVTAPRFPSTSPPAHIEIRLRSTSFRLGRFPVGALPNSNINGGISMFYSTPRQRPAPDPSVRSFIQEQ